MQRCKHLLGRGKGSVGEANNVWQDRLRCKALRGRHTPKVNGKARHDFFKLSTLGAQPCAGTGRAVHIPYAQDGALPLPCSREALPFPMDASPTRHIGIPRPATFPGKPSSSTAASSCLCPPLREHMLCRHRLDVRALHRHKAPALDHGFSQGNFSPCTPSCQMMIPQARNCIFTQVPSFSSRALPGQLHPEIHRKRFFQIHRKRIFQALANP